MSEHRMDDGRAADDPRPPTHDAAPVLTPTNARQGRPAHVARYVLGIGLVVVVIAFMAIYFGYTPPGA